MSVQRIASRYAKSLISLAREMDRLDRVREDLQVFRRAMKEVRELEQLMKSPIVKVDKKMAVVKQGFGQVFDPLTMKFFEVLARKGREKFVPAITTEFELQYRKIKHISSVLLRSAKPIPEALIQEISKKLKQAGKVEEHVEMETKTDPSLLGGFVLEFDGTVYDASVRRRLEQLRKAFEDNLYVSKIIAH